jgi:NaMN:DMB phosphoribosyltransferase
VTSASVPAVAIKSWLPARSAIVSRLAASLPPLSTRGIETAVTVPKSYSTTPSKSVSPTSPPALAPVTATALAFGAPVPVSVSVLATVPVSASVPVPTRDPVSVPAPLAPPVSSAPSALACSTHPRIASEPTAVPGARDVFGQERRLGSALSDSEVLVGETISGGTTTVLAVLTAFGERKTVSSSLSTNPLALER